MINRRGLTLALALVLFWPAQGARALSVEWRSFSGRERIIIRLEASDGRIGAVRRSSQTSIVLPFSSGNKTFCMAAPGSARLFGGIEPAPHGLSVKLKTAEFGFITTRPANDILQLDIYADRLGKRWRHPTAAAPAGTVQADLLRQPEGTVAPATVPASSALGSVAPAAGALEASVPAAALPSALPDASGKTAPPALGAEEASSVFSRKIEAPRPGQTVADAPIGGLSEQALPAQSEQPLPVPAVRLALPAPSGKDPVRDGDNYKLPAWPPLDMPASLPAPPPPPSGSGESGLAPQSALTGGGALALSSPRPQKNLFDLNSLGFNLRKLLPFAASAYAASASAEDGDYELVEAPFAYRAKLNVDNKPDWVEQPIPILLRVPKGVFLAGKSAAVGPTPEGNLPLDGAVKAGDFAAATVAELSLPRAQAPAPERPAAKNSTAQTSSSAQPTAYKSSAASVPAAEAHGSDASAAESLTPSPSAAEAVAGNIPVPSSPAAESGAMPAPAQDRPQPPQTAAPVADTPAKGAAKSVSMPPSNDTPTPKEPGPVPPPPAKVEPTKQKIYVDELGNPVEPPLVPAEALRDVDRKINDDNYAEAIQILNRLLLQHDLTVAQRELALHRLADATFSFFENNLTANYQVVMESSTAAINFNTKSPRNAAAYLRLGYTSLIAGNSYEAAGYFNVLRREFPHYENLALTYYYWGDYQYSQGNMNEAVEQFNYIVQNYPEHPISRDAALGLSRSYYRMGYFNDAFKIMLFIEQRWPNFYLDYPPVLSMLGDVAYRVGELDKARYAYWMYYNLSPDAEDADIILSRLGDIYTAGKFNSAAVQVYSEATKRFPAKDGGVISLMRLAEGGIYDDPILPDMFKVFERPYDQRPAEAYRTIIREYPGSPLLPLAKLKLAMWMLWQKDYVTVLDLCSEVVAEVPNSPLTPRAREVSMGAFTLLAAEDSAGKRYARAREIWERYPILRTQEELLDPDSRLALAVSQWSSSFQDEALKTLEPFFYGPKVGDVSEMALFLALNILVEHYRWVDIGDLAARVELWELTPQARNQTDYALALAYENQDKPEAAAPLWARLHQGKLLPPTQLANAAFYLARSAERQRDLESAYYVGQEALKLLTAVTSNDPERADIEKIKTQILSLVDIAESSGVLQQALEYAQQYLQYVSEGSLDEQALTYRMARIHKKRGDTADWVRILTDLSDKYPNSVYGKTAKSELASYRLGNEAARFSNLQ